MFKKLFCLFLVLCLFLTGCTKATEDVYKVVTEYKWVDDPNYTPSEDSSKNEDSSKLEDSTETPAEKPKPETIYVSSFGAKGDGKTDDGNAIMNAIFALGSAPEGSQLVFEKNKTYFCSDMMGITEYALFLSGLKNVTIQGDNTTIVVDKGKSFVSMRECSGVTVKGFNFDLKIRSHYVGTVEAVNKAEGYMDVSSDRDFGFDSIYTSTGGFFGFKVDNGTSRTYVLTKKLETLDKAALKYRVYADMSDPNWNTAKRIEEMQVGDRLILPVPGVAHTDKRVIDVQSNENAVFQDINVWNARDFVCAASGNKGTVTFENVDIMPPDDEDVCFVSWRDVFHCKANTAAFIWKNCTFKGSGDDIFNLSSNMMHVEEVISSNEVICVWDETNGSYASAAAGLPVIIWDADTGELIGKTTVKKVVSLSNNRYILSDKLPNLRAGSNIRFCFDTHCAPNSQIINCELDGTFRFHGGPVTVSNTKIRLTCLWIDNYTNLEGPIPHDVAFNNCEFDVLRGSASFIITSNSPLRKWKEGLFRLENISFNNCKGLKREYFSELNLLEDSVDYVKFSPALTE